MSFLPYYGEADERDHQIVAARLAALDEREGPRVGDFVIFADGVIRRFSHDWDEHGLQTSDGGSWYLGDGYISFSGGLHPTIKRDTLTLAAEHRDAAVWIFHHDMAAAHRGVHVTVPLRVFHCTLPSN